MATTAKHLKSTYTTNLGTFRYHEVNRDFHNIESQNRIKRIAESMKTEGLLPHAIVVTSKFYVVDGQHRLEAARIAGISLLMRKSLTPRRVSSRRLRDTTETLRCGRRKTTFTDILKWVTSLTPSWKISVKSFQCSL